MPQCPSWKTGLWSQVRHVNSRNYLLINNVCHVYSRAIVSNGQFLRIGKSLIDEMKLAELLPLKKTKEKKRSLIMQNLISL